MLTCTWSYYLSEVDGPASSDLARASFTVLLRWLKTCFEVVIPLDSIPKHGKYDDTCLTID